MKQLFARDRSTPMRFKNFLITYLQYLKTNHLAKSKTRKPTEESGTEDEDNDKCEYEK